MKIWKDEKGQGAIEYIMLVGGMVIAAIIIFVAYKRMTSTTQESVESGVNTTATKMNQTITSEAGKL